LPQLAAQGGSQLSAMKPEPAEVCGMAGAAAGGPIGGTTTLFMGEGASLGEAAASGWL
jgi:hypothetical protein